jgi:hypothetical protein
MVITEDACNDGSNTTKQDQHMSPSIYSSISLNGNRHASAAYASLERLKDAKKAVRVH